MTKPSRFHPYQRLPQRLPRLNTQEGLHGVILDETKVAEERRKLLKEVWNDIQEDQRIGSRETVERTQPLSSQNADLSSSGTIRLALIGLPNGWNPEKIRKELKNMNIRPSMVYVEPDSSGILTIRVTQAESKSVYRLFNSRTFDTGDICTVLERHKNTHKSSKWRQAVAATKIRARVRDDETRRQERDQKPFVRSNNPPTSSRGITQPQVVPSAPVPPASFLPRSADYPHVSLPPKPALLPPAVATVAIRESASLSDIKSLVIYFQDREAALRKAEEDLESTRIKLTDKKKRVELREEDIRKREDRLEERKERVRHREDRVEARADYIRKREKKVEGIDHRTKKAQDDLSRRLGDLERKERSVAWRETQVEKDAERIKEMEVVLRAKEYLFNLKEKDKVSLSNDIAGTRASQRRSAPPLSAPTGPRADRCLQLGNSPLSPPLSAARNEA